MLVSRDVNAMIQRLQKCEVVAVLLLQQTTNDFDDRQERTVVSIQKSYRKSLFVCVLVGLSVTLPVENMRRRAMLLQAGEDGQAPAEG